MLKIKDNVDLKELEKYGVYPRYTCNEVTGETYIKGYGTNNMMSFKKLCFKKKKRKIFTRIIDFKDNKFILGIDEDKISSLDFDLLYDLIKDGLVEKVDQ